MYVPEDTRRLAWQAAGWLQHLCQPVTMMELLTIAQNGRKMSESNAHVYYPFLAVRVMWAISVHGDGAQSVVR